MKKLNIVLAIALMATICSCGNSEQGSNEQNADSLATETAEQDGGNRITLTVEDGTSLNLRLAAAENNAEVKIVYGEKEEIITIKSDFSEINYPSITGPVTIYGDITKLYFYGKIKHVDLTQNKTLSFLDCGGNALTNLDVSQNTSLSYLDCRNNKLTKLDLSKNTALKELTCDYNSLTSLDLSKNTALKKLTCNDNPFTSLDISKNTELEEVYLGNEGLTGVDVSQNKSLKLIYCYNTTPTCYETILKSLPDRTGLENGMIISFGESPKDEMDKAKNWNIVVNMNM